MTEKVDVLIVGGGPAGITFARKLKKLNPGTSITMLRPEAHSMVYCAIPYAIEGLFDPAKVFKKDELVTEVGVDLVRRAARSSSTVTDRSNGWSCCCGTASFRFSHSQSAEMGHEFL